MTNQSQINQAIIDFANHLADLSTSIAKKYFRQENGEIVKNDKSPVTLADQQIEEVLRNEIIKKFSNHGIIGEEFGLHNPDSDYQWIIDPIDGTSSFIIGRPTFGTLISLAYKGKSILGIINQPISGERWLGIENQGAWFNNKAIKTRQCLDIQDAVISTTSPFFFAKHDLEKFQKLCISAKYPKFGGVIYGGDCYAYALLASGYLDLIIEPELQIYDYAALVPIIKMAGGYIGDWQGNELGLKSGVKLIAAGTKELYNKTVALMR